MIVGTNHFVSLAHAAAYYRPYGYEFSDVARKVDAGEIHLSKPPLKPNERIVMLDDGARYGVADDGPLTPRQRCDIPANPEA